MCLASEDINSSLRGSLKSSFPRKRVSRFSSKPHMDARFRGHDNLEGA